MGVYVSFSEETKTNVSEENNDLHLAMPANYVN